MKNLQNLDAIKKALLLEIAKNPISEKGQTTNERNNLYIIERNNLSNKQIRHLRIKIRNNFHDFAIQIYAKYCSFVKDANKKTELINLINKFKVEYKNICLLNDFSVESICANNATQSNKDSFKRMFDIILILDVEKGSKEKKEKNKIKNVANKTEKKEKTVLIETEKETK